VYAIPSAKENCMNTRSIFLSLVALMLLLMACSFAGTAAPTPFAGDTTSVTPQAISTAESTMPPLVPGTPIPTRMPPTATSTMPGTLTPTLTATIVVPTRTPKTASSGPLEFSVSIVGCQPDLSREGGVILTMRIDARGGNGVYAYYNENKLVKQIFERPATKGNAVIDAYRVESGDGQTIQQKIRFTGAEFGCP
jgi:hypothetical protein